MEHIYIDESGSMTINYCDIHPYFVIAMVRTKDSVKLKKVFKRFVSKHLHELKAADSKGSMFTGNKFKELKGNCFTPKLKREFVRYFCRNEHFEVFYIIADNRKIAQNNEGILYKNTARAFNYLIRLSLEYYIKNGYLHNDNLNLQLDERNEKTEAKHFLENYLNTELVCNHVLSGDCTVSYFDSGNNHIIQIADVFANLMYSELKTNSYTKEFDFMKKEKYIKHVFRFPLT